MNATDFAKILHHWKIEISSRSGQFLGQSQVLDIKDRCGYFFLLAQIYHLTRDKQSANELRCIFHEWREAERNHRNGRWNIVNGRLALLNFYCEIKSLGILSDEKYVSELTDDLAHDLQLGHIRKVGLLDGLAGIASVLLCAYQFHPSKQIEESVNKCLIQILKSFEWDQFGLSICKKYDPLYGNEPQPLYNSIDLYSGSAGIRYLLFQINGLVSYSERSLSLLNDFLQQREEKIFLAFDGLYPDLRVNTSFVIDQPSSARDNVRSFPPDYYHNGLGILAVNALTKTITDNEIVSRNFDLNISCLSLKSGWAGTVVNSTELFRSGIVDEFSFNQNLSNFNIVAPFDSNDTVGAIILEMRNHCVVKPYLLPSTTLEKGITINIKSTELCDHLIECLSPNFYSTLKNKKFHSVEFLSGLTNVGGFEIMQKLHVEQDVKDHAVREKMEIDETIMNLSYRCSNKSGVYAPSSPSFMDRLKWINFGDHDFMNLKVRLAPSTKVVRSIEDSNCQYENGRGLTEEPEEGRVILVSLSKPGYPVVTTLTEFNLILSCVDSANLLTIGDVLVAFEKFFEIEDDENVKRYFKLSCRRILEDAIIEGWIDVESTVNYKF